MEIALTERTMMYVDDILLVIGIGLHLLALGTVRSITGLLGRSSALRRHWMWLGAVITSFAIGYVALIVLWEGRALVANDLVALMLLLAGAFTMAVTRLSFITTSDVVRIAKLERDAIEDPLTGIYNRRYLENKLEEEVGRSTRLNTPLSAMMIDLDHFKHVNDTYGHEVGDQVLRHVCSLIVSSVRPGDSVVRYGGEEFVVLAPNCPAGDASVLGERMREKIAGSRLSLPGGQDLTVTASIGVSSLTTDSSGAEMLRAADMALYRAKREGRNRLCIATAGSPAPA
ncbi:MAG: hypothetical protein CMJ15_05905 [Pelagibacterium sp.]|nr:hypothetical protein [Pelagibacterium sp.]